MENHFAIFDELKKGDRVNLAFDDAIAKNQQADLIVKNRTVVGVGKPWESEKITFVNTKNPNGVKFFAYRRKESGKISFAIGDMGIWSTKITKQMAKGGGVSGKHKDLKDAVFLIQYNNLIYSDGKWKNTGRYNTSVNASANKYFTQDSVNKLAERLNSGGVSKQMVMEYMKTSMDEPTYKYWSEKMAKGGTISNGNYLDSLPSDKKSKILKNIASHYGISVKDAENEVRDDDAEMLYEYIANDNSLRMEIFNDMEKHKMAKGGKVSSFNYSIGGL